MLRYWLWLARAPGVGPAHAKALLAQCGTPQAVFEAGPDACGLARVTPEQRAHWAHPPWEAIARDHDWAQQPGHTLLALDDPRYPARLRELSDAPLVLFVQGVIEALASPQLAVVGSRNPTTGGARTAHDFARSLAQAGLAITSGLALGIDAAAHEGALAANGCTVAVSGCGPDRIYPAQHAQLAARILERGALVSEFAPGTPPRPENFPRRNRVISGLALGTLVVEAAPRSGSLITARMAMEQGREVFAIPGSIHNPLARGCHALIKQGAALTESMDDILQALGFALMQALAEPEIPAAASSVAAATAPDAADGALQAALGYDPVGIDELVERTRLTVETLSSMLLIMELNGEVASLPGARYQRLPERIR